MKRLAWVAVVVALSTTTNAQWLKFVPPGTPRTPDGKPNLAAPTPLTADKRPDLSGVWMHEQTPVAEMKTLFGARIDEELKVDVPGMELGTVHKYAISLLADFKIDQPPMRPEGFAQWKKNLEASDPANVCVGVPSFTLAGFLSEPIKIVQAPRMTMVMYEAGNMHRQIYSDGRMLPARYEFPAFLGYSVGRWDGDVFVVETAGFNGRAQLDILGHPSSEALKMTERFRRRDFGHLDMEVTFDDPTMYIKPFTIKVPHTLMADGDIFESFCENEKDRVHLENAKSKP
jgi:hypothetical protein